MKITDITEAINPAVFKRGFNATKIALCKDGNFYQLIAKVGAMPYIPGKKATVSDQFRIEAYAGNDSNEPGMPFNEMIGWVNFEDKDGSLEALDLVVTPKYRRKGIATEMYDFARDLNNDIRRSPKQTPDGRAFWAGKGA